MYILCNIEHWGGEKFLARGDRRIESLTRLELGVNIFTSGWN